MVTLLFFLILISCARDSFYQPTIKEGIWGRIEFREGDFMPPSVGKITHPKRKIFIFNKTHLNDVIKESATFYTKINTRLIATIESNNQGYFQKELPPGDYSIFVEEKGKYYANLFDGEGYIFPVTVKPKELKEIKIVIDYLATY